ncbi:MAG: hypothetical protein ACI86H_001879 [bacterium]|jgi:hypothetical protein
MNLTFLFMLTYLSEIGFHFSKKSIESCFFRKFWFITCFCNGNSIYSF